MRYAAVFQGLFSVSDPEMVSLSQILHVKSVQAAIDYILSTTEDTLIFLEGVAEPFANAIAFVNGEASDDPEILEEVDNILTNLVCQLAPNTIFSQGIWINLKLFFCKALIFYLRFLMAFFTSLDVKVRIRVFRVRFRVRVWLGLGLV